MRGDEMTDEGPKWKNRIVGYGEEDPEKLSANPSNWRVHPQFQQDALLGVLEEVGVVQDVIVSKNSGFIVDGHLRVALALKTGQPVVPVKYVDLTEAEEAKVLATLDPVSALATTDLAKLEELLADVETGNEAVRQMLDELAGQAGRGAVVAVGSGGDDFDDSIDEEEPARAQIGDVWQLGIHRVACIDATQQDQILLFLGSNAPSVVWADPPYGVEIVATNVSVGGGEAYDIPFGGTKGKKAKKGNVGGGEGIKARTGLYPIQQKKGKRSARPKGLGTIGGSKPFGSGNIRGSVGASNMIEVGKYYPVIGDDSIDTAVVSSALCLELWPDAMQVWWGGNYYCHKLPPSPGWLVWDKENTGNFADVEMAWTNRKKAARLFRHMWNGLMKASEKGQRRIHPTQKPVALAEWAFREFGAAGDVIFDPFLGSGISVIAAERVGDGRRVFGCELSPRYVDKICERWEAETGNKAILLGHLDQPEQAATDETDGPEDASL